MRFDPISLPVIALISSVGGCFYDDIVEPYPMEPEATLEFAVEGADVSERGTVFFNATSQELSEDGDQISLGMGTSLCDVDTTTTYPVADYYPEDGDIVEPLDVRFDSPTARQIVIEGGELGIHDSYQTVSLGVDADALAASWLGDDVSYLSGSESACSLTIVGGAIHDLPGDACAVADMTADDTTLTAFVAAGSSIAVVRDDVSFIDAPADELAWDADLGVLYARTADRLRALVEDGDGWSVQWSVDLDDAIAIDRLAGGVVILRDAGAQSIVEIRSAVDGGLHSTVTAEGSFGSVTGAAEAPEFALASYTEYVHVLELDQPLD